MAQLAVCLALAISVDNSIKKMYHPKGIGARYQYTIGDAIDSFSAAWDKPDNNGTELIKKFRITDTARLNISNITVFYNNAEQNSDFLSEEYRFNMYLGFECVCTGYNPEGSLVADPMCPPGSVNGTICPNIHESKMPLAEAHIPHESDLIAASRFADRGVTTLGPDNIQLTRNSSEFFYAGNPYDQSAKREWSLVIEPVGGVDLKRVSKVYIVVVFYGDLSCFVSDGAVFTEEDIQKVPKDHCLNMFDTYNMTSEMINNNPWDNLVKRYCIKHDENDLETGICRKYVDGVGLTEGQCDSSCVYTARSTDRGGKDRYEMSTAIQIVTVAAICLTTCCICVCLVFWVKAAREGRIDFMRAQQRQRRKPPQGDKNDPANVAIINKVMEKVPQRSNADAPETYSCCVCLDSPEETLASYEQAKRSYEEAKEEEAAMEVDHQESTSPDSPQAGERANSSEPMAEGEGEPEGETEAEKPPTKEELVEPTLNSWAEPECGHIIHHECLSEWLLNRYWRGLPLSCPVCRAIICEAAVGVHEERAILMGIRPDQETVPDTNPDTAVTPSSPQRGADPEQVRIEMDPVGEDEGAMEVTGHDGSPVHHHPLPLTHSPTQGPAADPQF